MSTRRLFQLLFVVALYALTVRHTTDPDMWWHLRTGEQIMAQGISSHDIFSYTVSGQAWVTHEWLAQMLMQQLFVWGGLPLLILLFSGLITAAFLLIYAVCPGQPYLAAFVTLLAAAAANISWGVRPQMFTLFFMALFVFWIERYKQERLPRWAIWLLPLFMLVWANLHSGYIMGVVLLGGYAVGEGLQRWFNPEQRAIPWPAIRNLALVTPLCFLVAALNPSGIALWSYPFYTLGLGALQTFTQEWVSPDFHRPYFWPFLWLMALTAVAFWWSDRQATWSEMLLFGGTAVAGLTSNRHIALFAVTTAPIVARHLYYASVNQPHLHRLLQEPPGSRPAVPRSQQLLNSLLLLVMLLAAGLYVTDKLLTNETAVANTYPVAAVNVIETTILAEQRVFNSFGWGGYLIWRGLPVFIDGRADVYGHEFMLTFLRAYYGRPGWSEVLDQFAIDYVLVERHNALAILLLTNPDWQLFYEDDVARLYVRQPEGA